MDFFALYPIVVTASFGLLIGSFLNVCILRIPSGESVVVNSSHCPKCNKKLLWWELIPVLSYLALRGKCSKCHSLISPQYPIIELSNSMLWVAAYLAVGFSVDMFLICLLLSALLTLSVIDIRTREIPIQTTIFIGILALIRLFINFSDIQNKLLGLLIVPGILLLILLISRGAAIGGGDVKLMAGAGLFMGFPLTLLSFVLACGIGSVVHLIRMAFFGAKRDLAMGPYLALGIAVSVLYGEALLNWYFSFFTF